MMIFCIKLLGYPLVNIQKAIENGPVEIVDLPINSMVIFHSYVKLPEGILIFTQTPYHRKLFFAFAQVQLADFFASLLKICICYIEHWP